MARKSILFLNFFKKVAQKRATFAPFSSYIEAHFYIQEEKVCTKSRKRDIL